MASYDINTPHILEMIIKEFETDIPIRSAAVPNFRSEVFPFPTYVSVDAAPLLIQNHNRNTRKPMRRFASFISAKMWKLIDKLVCSTVTICRTFGLIIQHIGRRNFTQPSQLEKHTISCWPYIVQHIHF